jgi:hypothetical protein
MAAFAKSWRGSENSLAAAASCYLVSLTAPLAFMEAWKKALEPIE